MTDVSCMKLHALSFFLSRCLSGIGVVTIPKARADGTVAEFSRSAQEIRVRNILIVYLIFIGGIMLLVHPVLGAAALIGAIGIFVYYRWMAVKNFGGTTGDLSGWFLCVCEVGVLVILAVVSKLIIKM